MRNLRVHLFALSLCAMGAMASGQSSPSPSPDIKPEAEVEDADGKGGEGGKEQSKPSENGQKTGEAEATKDGKKGGGGLENPREIEDFMAFVYTSGPRDPFISLLSSSTIVVKEQATEDISVESLMAFAEKLRNDLGERIRVVGVSVPPAGGGNPHALVLYATGHGSGGGGGTVTVPALPPRAITMESGLPVRYPPDETAFISRLAQLVAQNSPIKLKRDSRTQAVIFPVKQIDEKGVQISLPGYDEPMLLPVYRDIETFTGAGD